MKDDVIEIVNHSSASPARENETKCYICLGVDEENDDPPLRRDCSCRGSDAGFVHLECLVENAKNQNTRWDGRDLVEFTRPWEVCPICCKFYQSTLAVDISSEFLTFVQEAYPGDTRKQIEALDMRLGVLVTMRGGSLQPSDRIETSEVANQILALIAQLKSVTPKLSASYLMREAHAYKSLGQIALQERTKESAMRAVVHFEMQLGLEQTIGDVEGAADARFSIALARSKYEGSNAKNNEALLKAHLTMCIRCMLPNLGRWMQPRVSQSISYCYYNAHDHILISFCYIPYYSYYSQRWRQLRHFIIKCQAWD